MASSCRRSAPAALVRTLHISMRAVLASLLLVAACSSPSSSSSPPSPAPKDPPSAAAAPAPPPPAEAPPAAEPVKVRSHAAGGEMGRASDDVGVPAGTLARMSGPNQDLILGTINEDALAKLLAEPPKRPATDDDPTKLSKEEIDRVIKSHAGAFKACYQRALEKKPTLTGKIVTHFTIAADGKVTTATIVADKSTLTDETVAACIVGEFKQLQFPAGGGVVNYPMIFSSP